MPEVTVRPATPEDASAIKHIGEATWPAAYAFAGEEYIAHGLTHWWSEEAVLRGLRTTQTLLAERDCAVIGMGNIDLRGERPIIWKLYVLPHHHGTGAGHALMQALLREAPPDADGVTLEYTDGNDTAAAFYRRHGFTELRRDPPEQAGWPEQVWMIRSTRA
jgi:GNAT superfamily N-acetyltransferase